MTTLEHDSGLLPPEILARLPTVPLAPPRAEPTPSAGEEADAPTFWLSGDVIGCQCPECSGPMSVRLWLMAADCAACGCSIELTEEQEREARALLEQTAPAPAPVAAPVIPAPAPVPVYVPPPPAPVIETPPPLPVQQPVAPRRRRLASEAPIGVRKKLDDVRRQGESWLWLTGWLKHTPAWVVSAVLHVILIVVLGLIAFDPKLGYWGRPKEKPFQLVARVSDQDPVGDFEQETEFRVESPFTEASPFPVEELSKDDLPEIDTRPNEEESQQALFTTDLDIAEIPSTAAMVPGTIGMFKGRGKQSKGQLVVAYGGTSESEAAVTRGLRWLAKVQEQEGHWALQRWNGMTSDTAGAGLGVLPFLGAGVTHQEGEYRDTVQRALDYIIKKQTPDGDLRGNGGGRMYAHALSTIALCEAYAVTRDAKLQHPAQKAIDFIVKTQHSAGGWRYEPGQAGDTSVVGWQLMALRSGQMAYLKVPARTFEQTKSFLDSVSKNKLGSRYAYQAYGEATPTMSAEALLCRQYTGWPRNHPGLKDGVEYLVRDHLPGEHRPNLYMWYYATQVVHHYGGPEWTTWNNRMRELLIAMQEKRGEHAGSFTPRGEWAQQGGRIFMTSLSLLTLEVYYRHLPLYHRSATEVAASAEFEPAAPTAKPTATKPAAVKPEAKPTEKPGKPDKPANFDPLAPK